MKFDRRVVITGLGLVTGLGLDVETNWSRLLSGDSGVNIIEGWDHSDHEVHFAAQVLDFNPKDFMDHREAKRLARFSQFAIAAAGQALKNSQLNLESEDLDRVGCILGSGVGGLDVIEEQLTRLQSSGPNKVSPFFIPKMMANAASGQVAITFGVRGPNYTCLSACASANNAMGDAYRNILMGVSDVMVTGGAEAAITPCGIAGFSQLGALSRRNDNPQAASRPFDKNRDGFVMGEGAGILIFEELSHAKARGAKIYCEVLGVGETDDAYHITAPEPEGSGAVKAMTIALAFNQVETSRVSYINAHGTSTPYNDKMETAAIKTVFGELASKVAISSSKSMIGHMLGASGGAEMVICAKTIETNTIHQTINYETPDPECDLDYVIEGPRSVEVDCVLSNSLGFGGHNTSLLVGRYQD